MRLKAALEGNLERFMEQEIDDATKGVQEGLQEAQKTLKKMLRDQVVSAGLGSRLSKTWRDKFYPNDKIDAASLVYVKPKSAPQIIEAYDQGVTITPVGGKKYLAIPVIRRKKIGRFRITPARYPGKLQFIKNKDGRTGRMIEKYQTKGGKRKQRTIFMMVPQVRLKKVLHIRRAETYIRNTLPMFIQKHYGGR